MGEMNANLHRNLGKTDKGHDERIVVAVKASKEIPRTAIIWALTHVVQPGSCITLLVVLPPRGSGRKIWGFPRFAADCASGHRRSSFRTALERNSDITDLCSQMMLQLHDFYDPNKISVKIKIVSGSPCGVVAAESKRAQANWVVLDKQLKHEKKKCMEELQCNIVVVKHYQPKVLRLNLIGSPDSEPQACYPPPPEEGESPGKDSKQTRVPPKSIRGPAVTPTSSPEIGTPSPATEAGTSSVSSSDPGTSQLFASEANSGVKNELVTTKATLEVDITSAGSDSESSSPTTLGSLYGMSEIFSTARSRSNQVEEICQKFKDKAHIFTAKVLLEDFCELDDKARTNILNYKSDNNFSGNIREAISLPRNAPPRPPPLCSICQHRAPVFGKPPRRFSYAELELATGGFARANFLAEGGFGFVYRGMLPDGQAIAVKQNKLASSQGDLEFCSEVEVLSCAQHRNVVMLIGLCVEDRRRLLVYEYICNGSLDLHLYGCNQKPLEWSARQTIAVGAARGLRYLHEECRVGCIVHHDMRSNNILVTHDFEPMVGDFGLARWQPDVDQGVETRAIGTFGYLAPEYAQSGQITEKADVYSFGVVLMELVSGRKAVDISRPRDQQCLTEWARPLLDKCAIDELVDPRLGNCYSQHEACCMLYAASLCIRHEPHARPRMSQVLHILEGNGVLEQIKFQHLDMTL
ncbi:inactive protein kinase SELMODRAFT_444075 isoform X1 [Elaeis guineensis]|uniref:inactive protein kinase SELMODRAFT_444075 isoform X1 n=2 Tax=Elaeis guineensis var. tenera TaxID=51953 RepID=UPI003C6D27C2